MEQDPRKFLEQLEATRARLGNSVEALARKTKMPVRVKEALDERLTDARDVLERAASIVMHRADQFEAEAEHRLQDVDESTKDARKFMASHPLSLAVGSLTAGVLVGLFLARRRV